MRYKRHRRAGLIDLGVTEDHIYTDHGLTGTNRERTGLVLAAVREGDLIRMRTKDGMAIARAKGKLKGKKPELSDRRQTELRLMYNTGDCFNQRPCGAV